MIGIKVLTESVFAKIGNLIRVEIIGSYQNARCIICRGYNCENVLKDCFRKVSPFLVSEALKLDRRGLTRLGVRDVPRNKHVLIQRDLHGSVGRIHIGISSGKVDRACRVRDLRDRDRLSLFRGLVIEGGRERIQRSEDARELLESRLRDDVVL